MPLILPGHQWALTFSLSKMPKKRVQRTTSNKDQKENRTIQSRKRKASSPLGECNKSSSNTIGMDWNTKHILMEMGVELLSQTSTDSSCGSNSENFTPAVYSKEDYTQSSTSSFHLPPVPGAPRILLDSHRDNVTSCSDESSESSLDPNLTPTLKSIQNLPHPRLQLSINRPVKRQRTDTGAFDHFSLLSDEIILAIFSWLPKFVLAKCARVCKKWSRLVLDESLWKRIDLSTKTLGPGVLGHVISRGVWALRLAKSEIEGPIFTGPTSPIKYTRLSRLQYLDLSMAGTTPEVLEEIFSICNDLRKISLENLDVNDKVCSYIGENKNLIVLNMAMCRGLSANGLMPILSNCRQLESLHVGWTGLHRHSVVYLCLCLPPDLLKLNLSGCRENITDDEIVQLCKTCPNLRELDLSDSTALTSDSIMHVILHLRYLEHISLSRCYHIAAASITDLNEMPSLSAVDVFGILRENPLQVLKANLPRVEVNMYPFSNIARPTTGIHRTSIWGIRVRDNAV